MTPSFTVQPRPVLSRPPGAPRIAPTTVRHDLTPDGLLALDRLAELAELLPQVSVEHNLGAVPAVLPGGRAPAADLSPAEIVRSIRTNGCWIVLKNVEQDPEYAELLGACLSQLEPALTPEEGPSILREGFIFLSAPHSVTPVHIDPEHNVLLQIVGEKTMSIGRFRTDDDCHRQAEQLQSGGHRNLDEEAVDLLDFPLSDGDGVYVPVHAPHLVRNGSEVSISLSVTWRTRDVLREGRLHALNARLRARGLPTAPVPGSPRTAQVLEAVERGLRVPRRARDAIQQRRHR